MEKIIENQWHKSFEMRDELFLDEYIIMPNHLHAIVGLNKTELVDLDGSPRSVDLDDSDDLHVDARPCVYYKITKITKPSITPPKPPIKPTNSRVNLKTNYRVSENQNQFHHLLVVLNRT